MFVLIAGAADELSLEMICRDGRLTGNNRVVSFQSFGTLFCSSGFHYSGSYSMSLVFYFRQKAICSASIIFSGGKAERERMVD